MRFMRGQLRSAFKNGHLRVLATNVSYSRHVCRCICNISKHGLNRGGRLPVWPAICHATRLQAITCRARRNSTIAAEIPDDNASETVVSEQGRAEENEILDNESNEETLALVKEAFAASGSVPKFPSGFLLASRQTSQDLHAFLLGDGKVAIVEDVSLHRTFLKKLAAMTGLRVEVIDKRYIPIDRREIKFLYRRTGTYLILFKPKDFVAPRESIRRNIETVIKDLLTEFLKVGPVVGRNIDSFSRYIRKGTEKIPEDALLLHGHSLIMLACQNDISQIPILDLLDNAGHPIRVSGQETGLRELRQSQLTLSVGGKVLVQRKVKGWSGMRSEMRKLFADWYEHRVLQPENSKANADKQKGFTFTAGEWTAGEYLSRAARALNYGYVTCDSDVISPPIPQVLDNGQPVHLWESKIKMSDHHFDCQSVRWTTMNGSKKLAVLQACVDIMPQLKAAFEAGRLLPEDYEKFARYWGKSEGPSLESFQVSNGSFSTALVDARSVKRMVQALKDLRELHQETITTQWQAIDESLFEPAPTRAGYRSIGVTRPLPSPNQMARMRQIKQTLPISQGDYRQIIRDSITNNDITIIKATTGSGKTTQVPQFLLDHVGERGHNIVCTQPRRIAAISVAKRVADERGQAVGDEVGFQVRFRDEAPTATFGINYMTAGYLLRLFEADPKWICNRYTHIIFDEVHERDIDTDLLLAGMKNLMLHTPIEGLKVPKIVLMSATIDVDQFVNYFKDTENPPTVASVDVPGKIYPVSTTMLEDFWPELLTRYPDAMGDAKKALEMKAYLAEQLSETAQKPVTESSSAPNSVVSDTEQREMSEETSVQLEAQNEDKFIVPTSMLTYLIKDVLRKSHSGDVLVFLPGLGEIDAVADSLIGKLDSHHTISKLHSSLGDSNFDAWDPTAAGSRRVFLATNIAETSITLPNVTVVIDTGYSKQGDFDQASQVEYFGRRWISKAEVAQRRGRAGRTAEGQYYATYSRKQYDAMADVNVPEILRSNLNSIVLRTEGGRAFRRPVGSDLARLGGALAIAPSPPERQNVEAAVEQLKRLHAFTIDDKLTPLGVLLSRLPVEPEHGRLVLMGLLFRCLGPAILIASNSPDNPILHHPERVSDVARSRKAMAGRTYDDRIGDAAAWIKYATADQQQNSVEKQRLEQDSYLRSNSFTAMARHSSQLIDSIMSIMDVPRRIGHDYDTKPIIELLLAGTMAFSNTNSSQVDLIKALILAASGSRIAKWDGKHWRLETNSKIMPSPRSVNHDGHKVELRAANAIRREPGDLLCYVNLRKNNEGPAWAHETSVIAPLGALLFAESLRIIDDDILLVNDWMKYKIEPQGELNFTPEQVVRVILEYRKALERFMAQAFSDVTLSPSRLALVRSGETKANRFNKLLKNSVNPVRQLFAESLVEIFNFDKECRRERKELRRAAAEEKAPDGSKLKLFLQQLKGNV